MYPTTKIYIHTHENHNQVNKTSTRPQKQKAKLPEWNCKHYRTQFRMGTLEITATEMEF